MFITDKIFLKIWSIFITVNTDPSFSAVTAWETSVTQTPFSQNVPVTGR